MRYGMFIDLDECIGCRACVAACKERWDCGPHSGRNWVRDVESGSRDTTLSVTMFPGLCNHCETHPCTTVCPTGATYMDANGIVVVDKDVCIGCGNCVSACPYGARTVDELQGIVQKCNFCAPYVARGEDPACVTTCLAECRHFGDLDDPKSRIVELIQARGAAPLTTTEVQPNPKVFYAPASARESILSAGAIKKTAQTDLTSIWRGYTRPAAAHLVPPILGVMGVGAMLLNLRSRNAHDSEAQEVEAPDASKHGNSKAQLLRHHLGMRVLHWFNALSWLALVVTGTALITAPGFTLFGASLPRVVSDGVGGGATLMRLHVSWGLMWAVIIVPFFLHFKRGGVEAWHEVRLTRDDFTWLKLKPRVMLGRGQEPLPSQHKYNAGQKLFAVSALAGTSVIIVTGLVMTFHLGPPELVRSAILLHKLAVMLALVGLAVHLSMAAILREERPALWSMFTGHVERSHALQHNAKWVSEQDALSKSARAREEQTSAVAVVGEEEEGRK